MSIGRLLTATEAILSSVTQDDRKLAALLDKDFPKPVPVCPMCDKRTEVPCLNIRQALACHAQMTGEDDYGG